MLEPFLEIKVWTVPFIKATLLVRRSVAVVDVHYNGKLKAVALVHEFLQIGTISYEFRDTK